MVSKMVSTLSLGHDGAGSDCFGKTLNIGGKGLLAGRSNVNDVIMM